MGFHQQHTVIGEQKLQGRKQLVLILLYGFHVAVVNLHGLSAGDIVGLSHCLRKPEKKPLALGWPHSGNFELTIFKQESSCKTMQRVQSCHEWINKHPLIRWLPSFPTKKPLLGCEPATSASEVTVSPASPTEERQLSQTTPFLAFSGLKVPKRRRFEKSSPQFPKPCLFRHFQG